MKLPLVQLGLALHDADLSSHNWGDAVGNVRKISTLAAHVLALCNEVERLKRFHSPACNALLDDDSDVVLADFQVCTCGVGNR